jgi:hypothetical protein
LNRLNNQFPSALVAIVALVPLLLLPQRLFGQSQSINGTIRGQIIDPSGAPVADATVIVKNIDTGFTRTITTEGKGIYIAPNLPIGTYSVSTTSSSFAPYVQSGIHLNAGDDLTVNEPLKAGSVTTEVQVIAEAPIVEQTQTGPWAYHLRAGSAEPSANFTQSLQLCALPAGGERASESREWYSPHCEHERLGGSHQLSA